IIYASDYVSQRKLSDNVTAKHTADGAASPLIAMLAENSIDLAADAAAAILADGHETQRLKHGRNAETFEQAAELAVKTLTKKVRAIAQMLKKFYADDIQKLGTWSITINGNRVVIPTTPDALKTLIEAIKTRHAGIVPPTNSPLTVFLTNNPTIVLAQMSTDAGQAITDNDAAAAERLQKESRKQQRDVAWNPVMTHLRKIGGFLVNTFVGKEKKAGDWGYTVDDSPRAPKVRTSTIAIASTKTNKSVVVGGTFTNEGTTTLHVYRGSTTSGTPSIVPPGEMLGMTKGYSIITVVNPDTLKAGKFSVLCYV
ncbi:MAG: hypothetical protein JJE25_03050, partial [Bacteroidia bacterium]|nr:hypothetical protein [Bacteroidia bacterium]